jgi:hypothetical protein
VVGGAVGVVWVGSRALAPPEPTLVGSEQDALRAQQTLFEIVRRGASRRPPAQRTRRDYALSEAELNAFLSRHLGRVAGLTLSELAIRLVGDGIVELRGRLDLNEVAGEGGSGLLEYVPESWQRAGIILTLRGPLRLETETARGQAKTLRLNIDEAYLGRLRVPVFAVDRFGAAERLRRWSVPDSVSAVVVEKGRVVVQTDS